MRVPCEDPTACISFRIAFSTYPVILRIVDLLNREQLPLMHTVVRWAAGSSRSARIPSTSESCDSLEGTSSESNVFFFSFFINCSWRGRWRICFQRFMCVFFFSIYYSSKIHNFAPQEINQGLQNPIYFIHSGFYVVTGEPYQISKMVHEIQYIKCFVRPNNFE